MKYPYAYDVAQFAVTVLMTALLLTLIALHLQKVYFRNVTCSSVFRAFPTWLSRSNFRGSVVVGDSTHSSAKGTNVRLDKIQTRPRIESFDLTDEMLTKQQRARWMTAVCVVLSVIRALLRIVQLMDQFGLVRYPLHCPTMVRIMILLYPSIICSLYSVLINRVDLAFDQTIHQYSLRTIRLCYVMVIIVYGVWVIWPLFSLKVNDERRDYKPNGKKVSSENDKGMRICAAMPSLFQSTLAVLVNAMMMTILVSMFVRPIRKIFSFDHTQSHPSLNDNTSNTVSTLRSRDGPPSPKPSRISHNRIKPLTLAMINDLEMKLLPLKYTMITLTAVLSSIIAFALLAFGYGLGLIIDNTVNVVCLLLMSQYWTDCYWQLYGALLMRLYSMRMVSFDTHQSIVLMYNHFHQSRLNKQWDRKSIGHRIMASESVTVDLDHYLPE